MCTTITIDEKSVDVILNALASKMRNLNSKAFLTGFTNSKMQQDYNDCSEAFILIQKAKANFARAKVMATKK